LLAARNESLVLRNEKGSEDPARGRALGGGGVVLEENCVSESDAVLRVWEVVLLMMIGAMTNSAGVYNGDELGDYIFWGIYGLYFFLRLATYDAHLMSRKRSRVNLLLLCNERVP
jgi:hypothetical protein